MPRPDGHCRRRGRTTVHGAETNHDCVLAIYLLDYFQILSERRGPGNWERFAVGRDEGLGGGVGGEG